MGSAYTRNMDDGFIAQTDYSRWRMKSDDGNQTWHYLHTDEELKAWPQTVADKYLLGLETVCNSIELPTPRIDTQNIHILTYSLYPGPPHPPHPPHPPRKLQKWHRVLHKTPSRIRQLGLRIPGAIIPDPGLRHHNVPDQHAHPR